MEKITILETIIALAIVAAALVFVLRRVIKTGRSKGDCGCGCGKDCKCDKAKKSF
ncbi:MAG: FeoB-associated Cys-rich membrane protein [Muribaculaceae bacterium]|nr:FeoB-associated Cys-rich membrane protein [Muribaculaceae bacterium]